jgi:hypothetical protein
MLTTPTPEEAKTPLTSTKIELLVTETGSTLAVPETPETGKETFGIVTLPTAPEAETPDTRTGVSVATKTFPTLPTPAGRD